MSLEDSNSRSWCRVRCFLCMFWKTNVLFLFKNSRWDSVRLASKYKPQIRQRELSLLAKIRGGCCWCLPVLCNGQSSNCFLRTFLLNYPPWTRLFWDSYQGFLCMLKALRLCWLMLCMAMRQYFCRYTSTLGIRQQFKVSFEVITIHLNPTSRSQNGSWAISI